MARVILSNAQRQQLVELPYAANVKWRKALTAIGYASFDLPLGDPYATPTYLNPGNYVHIFRDDADTTQYANADFAGVLSNDYLLQPHTGVVTVQAAGLAQLLEVSIVPTTQSFSNLDVGTIANTLITTSDNFSKLGLTQYTVSTNGSLVQSFVAGWGDTVYSDLTKLSKGWVGDFEVRPDFSYAWYTRQGVDNPNLIVRYGEQGNIQVESQMHLVNTEMANQVYYVVNNSDGSTSTVYTASQTSVQFYGPRTLVVQDDPNTYTAYDGLTKAQLEVAKRAFPLSLLDNVTLVDTALLPFSQIHLGDRVLFEAPSLPMLQSFNGLQRILAVEYDDRKRTMNLTMGNALYTVLRGKLHEVRLYTSNP